MARRPRKEDGWEPPKVVWIASCPWVVKSGPETDAILEGLKQVGLMDPHVQELSLRMRGIPDPERMITLWHEIIHALLYNSGLLHLICTDDKEEEALVQALGGMVYQVLIENEWWTVGG